MTHLTYLEAAVVGLVQGVSELFPISSLGHNVLIPALVGGSWEADLNVSKAESPYLAFIVGLHVATALALLVYFRRDWVRIIGGFLSSLRERRVETADQRLAWMIVLATIPVGLVGLVAEHPFRVLFGKPIVAGVFLAVNGVILIAGERFRRPDSLEADKRIAAGREAKLVMAGGRAAAQPPAPPAGGQRGGDGPVRGGGGGRLRPAAVYHGLRPGHRHRLGPDPGPVRRDQPGRGDDGDRHEARPVPRGRRPVRLPVVPPGALTRRGAEDPGPVRAARPGHRWPDPARQHPVLHRRLRRDPVPGPLPSHPHSLSVRHLLPDRRAALRVFPRPDQVRRSLCSNS